MDQLLSKNNGIFYLIDEASRRMEDFQTILDKISHRSKSVNVKATGPYEFSVAHYTGKIVYEAREIVEKNRDFLSAEIFETLRQSTNEQVRYLFSNKLSKSGNLTAMFPDDPKVEKKTPKSKWGAALIQQETTKLRVGLCVLPFLKFYQIV